MRSVTTLLGLVILFTLGLGSAGLAQDTEEGPEADEKTVVAEVPEEAQQTIESPVYQNMMTEFYTMVGDYYEVSYDEVVSVLETGLAVDEVAAAFFVAARGEATATAIASRRVAGEAWHTLYESQGLYSNDFWIPLKGKEDQRVFSRLIDLMKGNWDAKLLLKDNEVVNLAGIAVLRSIFPKMSREISDYRAYGLQFAYILHQTKVNVATEKEDQPAQKN